MQIVLLIGACSNASDLSTDRLVTHEYGKDLNTNLLVAHLKRQYPTASVTHISITLQNYQELIASYPSDTVFINLCDGVETDGYPGLTIVSYLESTHRIYTGSGPDFYLTSTSKTLLKEKLIKEKVDTAVYRVLGEDMDLEGLVYPVIIKPSISYGSMLISTSSIVDSPSEIGNVIKKMRETGYTEEIFCETFLPGREFTILCSGSGSSTRVYVPAERVFPKTLSQREKILSYEVCWMGCGMEGDGEVPDQPYEYQLAPLEYQEPLMGINLVLSIELAKKAYIAVGGTGYGRVDVRTRDDTDTRGFVLEVRDPSDFRYELALM